MRSPPVMVAGVLLGALFAQPSAACHRFRVWNYPTPQRCGVTHESKVYHPAILHHVASLPPTAVVVPDIPLPDMSATWGGVMDSELELSLQRQKAIRQLSLPAE